jgi:uncharacterized protein (UPF0264 family)
MLGQENEVFLAVDAGAALLDKKTPAEEVLGAVLNPA